MNRAGRGQPALIPIVTRVLPPALLFSGDAALRSHEVRRVRALSRSVAWAEYCSRNIRDWPDRESGDRE